MIVAELKGYYAMPSCCAKCPIYKPSLQTEDLYIHSSCKAAGKSYSREEELKYSTGRVRPEWCVLKQI